MDNSLCCLSNFVIAECRLAIILYSIIIIFILFQIEVSGLNIIGLITLKILLVFEVTWALN